MAVGNRHVITFVSIDFLQPGLFSRNKLIMCSVWPTGVGETNQVSLGVGKVAWGWCGEPGLLGGGVPHSSVEWGARGRGTEAQETCALHHPHPPIK